MDARNFDDIQCLQQLVNDQALRTPDALAVVDGTVELTYKELKDITDNLAIQLIEEYGVKPDAVVGILLPRSVQYVIAYVAVLKAGGAYMPLELVYPKNLLERAISETETKVVFTNAQYANRVATSPHLVMLDEAPFIQHYETSLEYPPPSYQEPSLDHLAFCVMSSGTTGTPKGICQTHRAAIHSYVDRFVRFPYTTHEQDRVGAGVFFVWELVRPLCFGATCVVIPDHVLFDPPAVTQFIRDYDITRILFTPSLLQLILDTLPAADIQQRLAKLRYLWLCGEVVSRDLAMSFTSLLPNVELMNLYSISECHDVSIGDLKRELDPSRKYATCGKAIPGVKFYVVDLEATDEHGRMKLVPDGETGEVYVGGPVVGRGYLNMPEKTAERFVDNIFEDDPTCPRLYRTGDLGRVLVESQHLEILGRCDFMVKIRGYSVVLGAVETALAKHPKLLSAVVLAVGEEGSGDKKLVAYVVPAVWKDPPSASSVRQFLKDHLPTYAIPSTFCVIDALPVAATAAGKLDRKKLPSPETATRLRAFSEDLSAENSDPNNKNARLAPQNDTERAILNIWSDLLNLPAEELSTADSFFEVGGHSLLATKLVNLVNEKFGRTTETGLSIMSVVEAPTVREMSEALLKQGTDKSNNNKIKIDLQAEALSLDPSIFPFPTRKGNTMSRFRIESSALLSPRVVFLTGATGYLGAHILAQLLLLPGVTTICLARANDDIAAKDRLLQTLNKYQLLEPTIKALEKRAREENGPTSHSDEKVDEARAEIDDGTHLLDPSLIAIAGDLSKPLLGMDAMQFKALALEIDSIIHCGAEVNLIKPYQSLKESNVLGTQEILRLATTNGLIKTKVKPVHYISTNGIFPVDAAAYENKAVDKVVHLKEDVDLDAFTPFLSEGYAMTKWVAERMCSVAESRGLPISILRPGNMAGSSQTGVSNPDDLNYLLIKGMLEAGCAPIVDTNYALDLTPVDFAASAVAQLVVQKPQAVIGQRLHLQSPHKPVALKNVVQWLNEDMGYSLEPVTREEWVNRIAQSNEQLAIGWVSFEKYFEAYTWLEMDSDNLQLALEDTLVDCPPFDKNLLEKWFPKAASN
ncbi:amino acid adenylation enzyme/thioester reductase family protein [Nitzschia inconspicua]|uniref:Amino acid adenylation enzyme/thioester reductase family protein n=1 Tax=Nitzschia inconspicua TaxID=303405 RepID=A0A9K3LA38_9STRA|nr:amino acid adenylation enzyme/thioester reductase family protein [Nitzschia inconspicua]